MIDNIWFRNQCTCVEVCMCMLGVNKSLKSIKCFLPLYVIVFINVYFYLITFHFLYCFIVNCHLNMGNCYGNVFIFIYSWFSFLEKCLKCTICVLILVAGSNFNYTTYLTCLPHFWHHEYMFINESYVYEAFLSNQFIVELYQNYIKNS